MINTSAMRETDSRKANIKNRNEERQIYKRYVLNIIQKYRWKERKKMNQPFRLIESASNSAPRLLL